MYDLIIIGSGPAGLGAAIYGKRAGYSTLVLEKNPMSGGQVLNTCEVDNYLGLPGIKGGYYCSRCGAQKAWRARGKTAGWQRYFLLCDL